MVAGALVAQRAVDHDEIGRLAERRDLAGRGHADEKPAPRREQLLGDQHGKSGADRAADDAEAHRRVLELEQFGVIAGPARRRCARPERRKARTMSPSGSSRQISGTSAGGRFFLSPRLAQQIGRLEHRGGGVILIGEDRRQVFRIAAPDHPRFVPTGGRAVKPPRNTGAEPGPEAPTPALACGRKLHRRRRVAQSRGGSQARKSMV